MSIVTLDGSKSFFIDHVPDLSHDRNVFQTKSENGTEKLFVKLFTHEADFLKQKALYDNLLSHSDASKHLILPIHQVQNPANKKYGFTFPFHGMSLRVYQTRDEFGDFEKFLSAILQVAQAVQYLHNTIQICHGDLHEANIMCNADGSEIKLVDITNDLSKYFLYYEPPEQLFMTLSGASMASRLKFAYQKDIWCLGILCSYLPKGSYPFNVSDEYEQLSSREYTSSWSSSNTHDLKSQSTESWHSDDRQHPLARLSQMRQTLRLPTEILAHLDSVQTDNLAKLKQEFCESFNSTRGVISKFADLVFDQMCNPSAKDRPNINHIVVEIQKCQDEWIR